MNVDYYSPVVLPAEKRSIATSNEFAFAVHFDVQATSKVHRSILPQQTATIVIKSIEFVVPPDKNAQFPENGEMAPGEFASLCSQEALGHVWNNPAEDDAWRHL